MINQARVDLLRAHDSTEIRVHWRDWAACRGMDTAIFYPDRQMGRPTVRRDEAEAAKAVCRTCPVTVECLQFAIDTRIEYGVWGGKTDYQRRKIKRGQTRFG